MADRLKEKIKSQKSAVLNLDIAAEKKLDTYLPRVMGTDYSSLLREEDCIEYDPIHATCQKNAIFYISRFGVVYDMNKRKQQFYRGHKLTISAIAKHPYLRLVATGEVKFSPFIYAVNISQRRSDSACILHRRTEAPEEDVKTNPIY